MYLFLLFKTSCFVIGNEISCESNFDANWGNSIGTVKSCRMQSLTAISEPNTTISTRDELTKGLSFATNKKIFHLPVAVAEKFENLISYSSWSCSIKEISRENFKGLNKLRLLWLNDNQIEKIEIDTFVDQIVLEILLLREIFLMKFLFFILIFPF